MRVTVIGAGVSGLTCGVLFAEQGDRVLILADEPPGQTTSAVAAAMWFPYDCQPRTKVIAWALDTYQALVELAGQPKTGVSMIELRQFCRAGKMPIPDWAGQLGAISIASDLKQFAHGFSLTVPLTDTTLYLDYLTNRFGQAGGTIEAPAFVRDFAEIDRTCDVIVNCSGYGAKTLARDADLEPHRGQVALMAKIEGLSHAVVCDDDPLMYAIPRAHDCVFGGTNELTDERRTDPATIDRIVAECRSALKLEHATVLGQRAGIRPYRKSGVRLERERLPDGRAVVHNYGHGGSGFTLSWGCAREAIALAQTQ